MLIFSLLALFSEDPAIIARIGGYFSFYVSSMLGGFIAYRKCGGYTFLAGLFTGLGVFVLTALLSILIPSSETSMNVGLSILLRMICVAAAVGGAYLGAYRPSPRKRRRRK
jgi:putative membrane protein (TIGR04086 family)